MIDTLRYLWLFMGYPFVRYALIVGALVALCSSLLGTTLVMRRMSFIGDGLSHVAFGAYAVAAVAGISQNMLIIVPVTVIAAVLLLRRGKDVRVKGDAAIAMFAVLSLSLGYLLMNVFSTSANVSGDVCGTLFGSTSLLTLTRGEVIACAIMSVVVVGSFVLLYNRVFAVTFDEAFAAAVGVDVERYNLILAVMVAFVIVVGMSLVGALLLSALVVFPSLAAMRVFHTFKRVTICAALLSVGCAVLGMVASMALSTPVGSTIVLLDAVAYGVCCLVGLRVG